LSTIIPFQIVRHILGAHITLHALKAMNSRRASMNRIMYPKMCSILVWM